MAEYDRIQKKQESRAIANGQARNKQLKRVVDNRRYNLKGLYQLMAATSDLYIRSDKPNDRKFNLRNEHEYKLNSANKVYTRNHTFSGGMSTFDEWKYLPFKEGKSVWKISSGVEMGEILNVNDRNHHHCIHLVDDTQNTKEEAEFKTYMQHADRGWVGLGKLYEKEGMKALGPDKDHVIISDTPISVTVT